MKKYIIWSLVLLLFFVQFPIFPTAAAAEQYVPASGVKIDGIRGTNGIYYGEINLSFDNGIEYSMDQGQTWKTYSNPQVLTPTKGYNIWYRSSPKSAYSEVNLAVKKDSKPPMTTVELLNGTDSYTKDQLQIKLSAVDNESGVSKTEYSTDQGQTWLTYSSPVTVSDESQEIFSYRSVDKSGNIEKTRKLKTLIDQTPPDVPGIKIDPMHWTTNNVTVSVMDGIDQNSGTIRSEYKIGDNGSWITYVNPFVISEENQYVYARSIDNAGNISPTIEAYIPIDRTAPQASLVEMSEKWEWLPVNISIDMSKDVQELNNIQYEYKIGDDGKWQEFFEDFEINTLGETPISFRSFDEAGNYSQVVNKVARFDNVEPTEPTEFKVSNVRYNRFDLSWTGATDNIAIKGYDIYTDDDEYVTTVEKATYQFTGLQANTTYKFKVVTYDNAYNESDFSKTIEVTTHSRPDFQSHWNTFATLRGDGTVWTWGNNETGILGDGTVRTRSIPKKVPNLSDVKSISMGDGFVLAQKTDGTVWGWGGYPVNSKVPKAITEFKNAQQLYVNNQAVFVVQQDGNLWAWGKGTLYGSHSAILDEPVNLYISDVKQIDMVSGYRVMVLTKQGLVWIWGKDNVGKYHVSNSYIPDTFKNYNMEKKAPVNLDDVVKIAAGNDFNMVLRNNKEVFTWGYDASGQLGNSTENNTEYITGPVLFYDYMVHVERFDARVHLENIVDIDAAVDSAYAVDDQNNLWGWGNNGIGQLAGLPDKKYYSATPLKVGDVKQITTQNVVRDRTYTTFVLKKDNTLVGWGDNSGKALGDSALSIITPRSIMSQVDQFRIYDTQTMMSKDDETFWMFGTGVWNGTEASSYSTPKQVVFGDEIVSGDTPPVNTDVPNQPSNLKADEVGSDYANISWNASKGIRDIQKYLVYLNGEKLDSTTSSSYQLTKLQPNQTYEVTVEAVDTAGFISESSNILQVTTTDDLPSKPTNLIASNKTYHTVELKWDASKGVSKITGYKVFKNGEQVAIVPTPYIMIRNLRSGDAYQFTVQAVNANEKTSKPSEALTVELEKDIPTAPQNLSSSKQTSTSIDLAWKVSTSQGVIEKYLIYVNDAQVGTSTSTQYTINNLQPSTEYKLQVIGVTSEGYSSVPSIALTAKTLMAAYIPKAPISATVSNVNIFDAKLTWDSVDDASMIKSYNVYVNGKLYKNVVDKTINFNNLEPLSNYKVYITAISITDNESDPSEEKSFITKGISSAGYVDAGSGKHMLLVKPDGSVWGWGDNMYYKLNIENLASKTTNKTTAMSLDVSGAKVARGDTDSTWIVKNDGTVWAVGTVNYSRSKQVSAMKNVEDIIVGYQYGTPNYMLTKDGKVYSFSNNSPESLTSLNATSIIGVAVQSQIVVGLKADGTVWNLNKGTILPGLSNILSIKSAYALKADGTVWSIPNTSNSSTAPTQIAGLSNIISIDNGIALAKDGSVWTWGSNSYGEIGNGTISGNGQSTPIKVPGLNNVIQISSGSYTKAIIKADGSIWTWGDNSSGQLGNATVVNSSVPVKVIENTAPKVTLQSPLGTEANPAKVTRTQTPISWNQSDSAVQTIFSHNQIQIMDANGKVIVDSGEVREEGEVGNTNSTASWISTIDLPVNQKLQVRVRVKDEKLWSDWSAPNWFIIQSSNNSMISISAGDYMSVVKNDGNVWSWGLNNRLQLADGSYTTRNTPVQSNTTNVVKVRTSNQTTWIVKKDGNLWYWGGYYYSPTQVSNINGVSDIEASSINQINYVLKKDGSVWKFNDTSTASLTKAPTFSFEKLNISSVLSLTARSGYVLALKADGTVWDIVNLKQISGINDVVAVSSGTNATYAVKTDGSVWVWGSGLLGNGINSSNAVTTPIKIPDLSNVIDVAGGNGFGFALTGDGNVLGWGANSYGQLGIGTTVDQKSPVKLSTLNGVSQIAAGNNSSAAIKTDGTVLTWGNNPNGMLGTGNTTSINTPKEIKVTK